MPFGVYRFIFFFNDKYKKYLIWTFTKNTQFYNKNG